MWLIKWNSLYAGTKTDWCSLWDEGVLKFNTYDDALDYMNKYIWEDGVEIVEG